MRQITSLLREAATRRRLIGAGNEAGGVSADPPSYPDAAQLSNQPPNMRYDLYWPNMLCAPFSLATSSHPQPPYVSHRARVSADFTARVMARVATPPPELDPRERRARRMRARMRRAARVYMTLVLVSGVALLALAALAPSVVLGLITALVSLALIAITFAAYISRATGGIISGFGVAYVAMLATLSSTLLLVARRLGRGSSPMSRRR